MSFRAEILPASRIKSCHTEEQDKIIKKFHSTEGRTLVPRKVKDGNLRHMEFQNRADFDGDGKADVLSVAVTESMRLNERSPGYDMAHVSVYIDDDPIYVESINEPYATSCWYSDQTPPTVLKKRVQVEYDHDGMFSTEKSILHRLEDFTMVYIADINNDNLPDILIEMRNGVGILLINCGTTD